MTNDDTSIQNIILTCPHCNDYILIEKLNCKIFRHGVFISSNKQIDPHSSKELCNFLTKENLIYGCGKPFKVIEMNDGSWNTEICDYI
jgi:hypothetical protein